jgi:nicotinate-nucleotide pyrophosphorylase (carboxylating)
LKSFTDYERTRDTDAIIINALAEDIGPGDATVRALRIAGLPSRSTAIAKESGVLAGINVAIRAFELLDGELDIDVLAEDGSDIEPGRELFSVKGKAGPVLAGERVALNFLQRMSGIATLTRRYVEAVGPEGPAVMDTRKTTPGLRVLEKYAVSVGGGVNHRMGLYDAMMIKDNHKRLFDGIADAVERARANNPDGLTIVAEAETAEEALAAEAAGADVVMLDNFTPEEAVKTITRMRRTSQIEISGGVTLETVGEYAKSGADRISVGELTHSAPALDISMETFIGD